MTNFEFFDQIMTRISAGIRCGDCDYCPYFKCAGMCSGKLVEDIQELKNFLDEVIPNSSSAFWGNKEHEERGCIRNEKAEQENADRWNGR